MKKIFLLSAAMSFLLIASFGQNSGPYWRLTGNNNTNSSSKLGTTNAQNLRIVTNNIERMRINASGNVGIGTTNPGYRLEIKSSVIESNNNTNLLKLTGRNPVLLFSNENNFANGYIKSWTNAPYAPFTNGLVIGSTPGYPIFLSTNYGATMVVADNNNVGIGTTTPEYKLVVKSSSVESNDNTNVLKLAGRNPLIGFYDESNVGYGYIKSWTHAPYAPFTNGMVIGSNPGYPIFLSTNYGMTMIIADNNNVGIGTANPAYKLSVNGTIQAKEVRVETGWADYVFEKDYPLLSLESVDDYIKKNKHLPGVASIDTINKSGLALGEMQTKTMEKVEENTLYIIKLNNKIKLLEQKIEELTKLVK